LPPLNELETTRLPWWRRWSAPVVEHSIGAQDLAQVVPRVLD